MSNAPDGEVAQWRLAEVADLGSLLIPLLASRVRHALHALAVGTAVYLHGGRSPGEASPLLSPAGGE